MEYNKIIDVINNANSHRYEDGKIVNSYLKEPYHKLRIKIALDFLSRGISRQFPTLPKDVVRVIDIGSGSGEVAKMIFDLGFNITATDLKINQINYCLGDRFAIKQLDANVTFPFPTDTFHAIFSGELIEHVFDTRHFLSECYRILKPNGLLVLTTPNLAGIDDRLKFLFGRSPRHINPLHPYLKLHIRQFTKSSLTKTLKALGFGGTKIKSNYTKVYLTENTKLQSRIIAKLFPSLGGSLISFSIKK